MLLACQVFLALPTDCPTHPDGSYRKVEGGSGRNSVVLYASDDEGLSFEQVIAHPVMPIRVSQLGSLLQSCPVVLHAATMDA